MSQKPLLSITIPTYNRAKILDKALNCLLPQVIPYKEKIELIISDNASEDNTQDIINNYINKYGNINIRSYKQKINTGYYGNFRKCREMSEAKYFWLLSDNDHIQNNVIDVLLKQLDKFNEIGAFYLHNIETIEKFSIEESHFDLVKEKHNEYSLMLISSIIMLNNKSKDEYVINNYQNNSFLGFLFLCNSLIINKKIYIISGKIYKSFPTNVYFNVFKSWTEDVMACVDYMMKINLIDNESKHYFVDGFLQRVVVKHVLNYCIKKKIQGRSYGTKKEIKKLLDSYYLENNYYRNYIAPLFIKSRLLLAISDYKRRILNKIKRILFKNII